MIESKPENVAESRPAPPGVIASNYQYWRDHGKDWGAEYDARKLRQPYLHLQEWMFADYFLRCAPCKVLEFGCGVGRHLRHLSQIPGVEIHGFDQSAGMVSCMRRWTDQAWIDAHVTLGMPTGRLPFGDGQFDVVYTSEVLLHVRPEDLPGILRELTRVARGHVLHIEPPPTYPLVASDHEGCWSHDLVGAYALIGRACEQLPAGYECHAPFRVALQDSGPSPAWSPALLQIMRRADRDLRGGLAAQEQAAGELEAKRGEFEGLAGEARRRLHSVEGEAARLHEQVSTLQHAASAQQQALQEHAARAAELDRQLAGARGECEAARQRLEQALRELGEVRHASAQAAAHEAAPLHERIGALREALGAEQARASALEQSLRAELSAMESRARVERDRHEAFVARLREEIERNWGILGSRV